jgi:hypothetical protein
MLRNGNAVGGIEEPENRFSHSRGGGNPVATD